VQKFGASKYKRSFSSSSTTTTTTTKLEIIL
jgi:hypothetical protein